MGSSHILLDLPSQSVNVRAVIDYLASKSDFSDLKSLLMDRGVMDPRPNALIMVSGREISTLDGLDTLLNEGDELSFLPIAHGG
jgi:molybdopterin converting factor small subunit